ncbi:hypothetical protein [Pseudoduganella sp. RAF53_2]|uniref:hypothetical protein n=1 Tax=unclassified Pseudoduganella TaxID=2637179 RepID=UPI003F9BBADC
MTELSNNKPKASAVPEQPEMESLADLTYAQQTPEDWDADYKSTWQKLQVAERNKAQWRTYALKLHSILTGTAAVPVAFAASPQADEAPDPRPLFDRKLADLKQRGYEVIGRILHKDGEYALFDSSCRWLTQPQYWRLMHEQDGSLFAEPKAVEPVAWIDPQALVNFKAGTATKEWMWASEDFGLVPVYGRAAPLQQVPSCEICEGTGVTYGKRCECVGRENA